MMKHLVPPHNPQLKCDSLIDSPLSNKGFDKNMTYLFWLIIYALMCWQVIQLSLRPYRLLKGIFIKILVED